MKSKYYFTVNDACLSFYSKLEEFLFINTGISSLLGFELTFWGNLFIRFYCLEANLELIILYSSRENSKIFWIFIWKFSMEILQCECPIEIYVVRKRYPRESKFYAHSEVLRLKKQGLIQSQKKGLLHTDFLPNLAERSSKAKLSPVTD